MKGRLAGASDETDTEASDEIVEDRCPRLALSQAVPDLNEDEVDRRCKGRRGRFVSADGAVHELV